MPKYLTCALPGCSDPLLPGKTPFGLGGHPGKYHSRECVTIAFQLMRQGKKFAKAQPETVDYVKQDEREEAAEAAREEIVQVKAEEFGGAEVFRRYCDNPACKGPITVSWKGRRGEYCSNKCLKTEKVNYMTTATTETTATNASPIAAGVPAAKKAAKKTAAPAKKSAKKTAAPAAKKSARPAATGGERSSFAKDGVIKIVKKAELAAHGRRGKAGDAFDALKDGITVEKFRDAVKKKNPKNGDWYAGFTLKFAAAEGWISVK